MLFDPLLITSAKKILESLVYYATVTRTKTNTIERQFAQWCGDVRKIKTLDELDHFTAESIVPVITGWKLDYKGIFMALGIDNIQQYRIRFILGRIGRYVEIQCQSTGNEEAGVAEYTEKGVEIEHIMPQTCDDPSKYGFDKEGYDNTKNRLGNLTLLEKSINASIQNENYQQKCEDYEKSKFYLTKSLRKLENVGVDTAVNKMNSRLKCWTDWNGQSILERQEMLYELSESIWGL